MMKSFLSVSPNISMIAQIIVPQGRMANYNTH